MIEKLKELNNKIILENQDNVKELEKQQIISKILNKENSFTNMSIEYAYSILRDLKIPEEQIKNVYEQLI